MKKGILYISLALLLAISLVATACPDPVDPVDPVVFLSFGTCAPGGAWYPIGAAMSVVVEDNTDLRITAEATDCSVENTRLVGQGDIDLAFTTGFVPFQAMAGTGPFEPDGPMPDIRAIMQIWGTAYFYIARDDAGITELSKAQLMGKDFGCSPPGDSGDVYTRVLLEDVLNIDLDDDLGSFTNQSMTDNVDALVDGDIHIMHTNGSPLGAAAVLEVFARHPNAVLLPVDGELFDDLRDLNPEVVPVTIPAENYGPGQAGVVTFASVGQIIVNIAEIDDDDVYEFTKGLHEGLPALRVVHPAVAEMTDEHIVAAPYDYHPAAIQYYQDVGIWPD